MVDKFANEAGTTLAGAIDATQTTITVADASEFPGVPFRIRIEDEFMRVTAVSGTGNVNWTVERSREGSIGATHADATEVWHVFTAGAMTAFREDIDELREEYTIALIPDTQFLSNSSTNIAHFQAAADYILANQDSLNIQLVGHLGDVVDTANATQFDRANGPMSDLLSSRIPTIVSEGNHDYDDFSLRDLTTWNTYFGPSVYSGQDWFGAVKDAGVGTNLYFDLMLGGRPTLVFALETFPQQATMDWADGIVSANPHHDVIVFTHSFLYIDGERTKDSDAHGPTHYAKGTDYSGAEMWNSYLQNWRNLKLVASAHHIAGNIAERVDYGTNGNVAYQQFANWQEEIEGGEGRIVLLTINPQTGASIRKVYNPGQSAFDTTAGYERPFVLDQQRVSLDALDTRYVNEGDITTAIRGSAAITDPDTTVAVSHGAETTPNAGEIQVTPASSLFNAAEFWLSAIGADTFTVNLDAAPGVGNTVDFHWLYMPGNVPPTFTTEAFTTSGTWDWAAAGQPSTVEVLVVAGGGGGGGYFSGGGGGAGGVVYDEALAVSGDVAVTVGAGGTGGDGTFESPTSPGGNGGDSVFGALTATGGGGGGSRDDTDIVPGADGGSGGGGGARGSNPGGSGVAGQGNAGGTARTGITAGTGGGAGGGGASAAAVDVGSTDRGTDGGAGIEYSQFAAYGDAGWFSGGGGGGTITGATPGNGGQGGGGNGNAGSFANGLAGTANTGGGGGGAGNDGTDSGSGGAGGSGIVLVRYPTP